MTGKCKCSAASARKSSDNGPGELVKRITRQITADPTLTTNQGIPVSDNP
jgi:hypothetical protein